MMIRRQIRWLPSARRKWYIGVALAAYAALFVLFNDDVPGHPSLPIAVPTILGTALSIILGFRTGAAYDRWWEARKVWGAIVNDSRTLARQVLTLIRAAGEGEASANVRTLQRELVYRQIGWSYALSRSLRGQDPLPVLDPFLSHEELVALQAQDNRTNAMLQTQGERVRDARKAGYLDPMLSLPLEDTLRRLTDHMGKCERIKNTTFPTPYGYIVTRCIWLFFFLLPPALVPFLGWWTVPFSMVVALTFVLIDAISDYLKDPFENQPADTPMTAISRVIEINLRQQLGETDVPPKLEPVDGVLL